MSDGETRALSSGRILSRRRASPDLCMGMYEELCIDMEVEASMDSHVHIHVYRHVYSHVYRHVYRRTRRHQSTLRRPMSHVDGGFR